MFKGLGGLGDMGKMMKSAQEMQSKLTALQETLDNTVVTGEAGAGLVRAHVSCKGEVRGLDIAPSILVPEEKEVIEDLIVAAIRDAQTRAEQKAADEMRRLTGALGLPADFKLPL